MAEIVGAVAVPHTPHFPLLAERDDDLGRELRRLYGAVAERVLQLRPDVIVFVTADHYNNFFLESIPIFSIGVAERIEGPSDYDLPRREMVIDDGLARSLQTRLVAEGFDVGQSQEFQADHPFTIPLNFVVPDTSIPLVPVYVSTFLRPIPTSQRCYALGHAIRRALEAEADDHRRVMVLATGSFSLEIGGPRMSATSHTGVPAPDWMARIMECLKTAQWDRLVAEATDEQLAEAGNAGGETLLWVTMLGMLDPAPPVFLEAQPEWGHAYGAWVVDGAGADGAEPEAVR